MELKCFINFFLIGVISTATSIQSESTSQNYHEKHDLVNILHDATSKIGLTKNLNKIYDDPNFSLFVDEIDFLSGKNLKPLLIEILKKNGSDRCVDDLLYTFENLMPLGGWGSKMLDSFAKPERGIFQGHLHWLGDFNECVGVYAPKTKSKSNTTVGGFYGQYCTLTVTANLGSMSLPLSIGTCLPDSCHPTGSGIQLENQIGMSPTKKSSKSIFTDAKLTCQPKFVKLTTAAICVILLLSLFFILAAIGSLITAYEHFAEIEENEAVIPTANFTSDKPINEDINMPQLDNNGDDLLPTTRHTRKARNLPAWLEQVKPFFNCFCIFTNGAKLLDTSNTEGQLPCLHGIRFLSLSWVIVCHTYLFVASYIRNMNELIPLLDNWPFQIIMNGFYSVDSFFLLSGFLLTYLFFEMSAKTNGKVPWLYFYIHRYVRLTPVYMIVLGFHTAILPYLGSGPFWPANEIDASCQKNWWRNLLYINNFYDNAEMCVGWSWYLANDMQFFVISPIILIALWRKPVIGYAILALLLNATTTANFVISYQNELIAGFGNIIVGDNPLALLAGMLKFMDWFNMIYLKPYTRISPYLVGIALAYYLYKRKENGTGKNSLLMLTLGWLISSGITVACLFGLYHRNMSNLEIGFYNAFNRTCYAGGLAWVMYVCLTGQGGVVNKILSFKLFIPLSRLTYCAYLVHPIVQMFYYTSMKSMIDISHITMVVYFLGFLMLSYCAAFITSVLFESPIIRLDKFVRSKLGRK